MSLPTDGLYAQTIMDECVALEEHFGPWIGRLTIRIPNSRNRSVVAYFAARGPDGRSITDADAINDTSTARMHFEAPAPVVYKVLSMR